MDIHKIISELAPIASAGVSSILTYMVTRSNNRKSLAEKEYEYIIQERTRMNDILQNEVETLRNERIKLSADIVTLRVTLEQLDTQEEECQRKLLQLQYHIQLLKKDRKNESPTQ